MIASKKTKLVLATLAAMTLLTPSLVQYNANQALQSELSNLRHQFDAARAAADKAASQLDARDKEIARLSANASELVKLRGEVARYRADQRTAASTKQIPPAGGARLQPATAPAEPMTARLNANLAHGQSLVTGGWSVGDGRRRLAFISPAAVNAAEGPASVHLTGTFMDASEAVIAKAGLNQLLTDNKDTSQHQVLSAEQMSVLIKYLMDTAEADILSAPRVQTADGREASIYVGPGQPNANQDNGIYLNVTPQIAADGSGLNLSLSMKVNASPAPKPDSPAPVQLPFTNPPKP